MTCFPSVDEQLTKFRRWNDERGWEFEERAFDWANTTAPAAIQEGNRISVLVPYLLAQDGKSGVRRTFDELWELFASGQKTSWRGGWLDQDRCCLLLKIGIIHPFGLRWETIDFGDRRHTAPDDGDPASLPHAGILSALTLYPELADRMDGNDMPYLWLPGYEVWTFGFDGAPFTPYFIRHSVIRKSTDDDDIAVTGIELNINAGRCHYPCWSVPMLISRSPAYSSKIY